MRVGRSDGQATNTVCRQKGRRTGRQVEKQRDKTQTHRHTERGMDAYVRLSRFPTEWEELAGWCWLLGVNCDCDCDWNWRQRSGSRSSRKERCLARAYRCHLIAADDWPNALAMERQLAGTWAASSRWHTHPLRAGRISRALIIRIRTPYTTMDWTDWVFPRAPQKSSNSK